MVYKVWLKWVKLSLLSMILVLKLSWKVISIPSRNARFVGLYMLFLIITTELQLVLQTHKHTSLINVNKTRVKVRSNHSPQLLVTFSATPPPLMVKLLLWNVSVDLFGVRVCMCVCVREKKVSSKRMMILWFPSGGHICPRWASLL